MCVQSDGTLTQNGAAGRPPRQVSLWKPISFPFFFSPPPRPPLGSGRREAAASHHTWIIKTERMPLPFFFCRVSAQSVGKVEAGDAVSSREQGMKTRRRRRRCFCRERSVRGVGNDSTQNFRGGVNPKKWHQISANGLLGFLFFFFCSFCPPLLSFRGEEMPRVCLRLTPDVPESEYITVYTPLYISNSVGTAGEEGWIIAARRSRARQRKSLTV